MTGQKITQEQVKEILGQTADLQAEKLLMILAQKDAHAAIAEINRVVESGGNLRVYTEELLEILRELLLQKVGVVRDEVKAIEGFDEIGDMRRLIEIFSKAAGELKEAIIPQLPLELAVVEWCAEGSVKAEVRNEPGSANEKLDRPQSSPPISRPTSHFASPSSHVSLEEIQKRWQEVLLRVRPHNYSIEALLRATRPIEFSGQVLTIEAFYQFHKDKLETAKCREIIEEVVKEIFGVPLSLKCILGQKPMTVSTPLVDEPSENMATHLLKGNGDNYLDIEGLDEDIIKVAEEIFNGKGEEKIH